MMWPAIFADNAKGNRIPQYANATCLAISGSKVGAPGTDGETSPGCGGPSCGGGSALSNPGSRNVAGDTLGLMLIPLQPAPSANKVAPATKAQDFR
jgi:hypothetical protein